MNDQFIERHRQMVDKVQQEFLRKILRVGDVVMAVPPSEFRTGAVDLYEEAIVIKPWPLLTLASFDGKARWQSNVPSLELHRIGHVWWWGRRKAMRRVKS